VNCPLRAISTRDTTPLTRLHATAEGVGTRV
jgi:hypothetical protein